MHSHCSRSVKRDLNGLKVISCLIRYFPTHCPKIFLYKKASESAKLCQNVIFMGNQIEYRTSFNFFFRLEQEVPTFHHNLLWHSISVRNACPPNPFLSTTCFCPVFPLSIQFYFLSPSLLSLSPFFCPAKGTSPPLYSFYIHCTLPLSASPPLVSISPPSFSASVP